MKTEDIQYYIIATLVVMGAITFIINLIQGV